MDLCECICDPILRLLRQVCWFALVTWTRVQWNNRSWQRVNCSPSAFRIVRPCYLSQLSLLFLLCMFLFFSSCHYADCCMSWLLTAIWRIIIYVSSDPGQCRILHGLGLPEGTYVVAMCAFWVARDWRSLVYDLYAMDLCWTFNVPFQSFPVFIRAGGHKWLLKLSLLP